NAASRWRAASFTDADTGQWMDPAPSRRVLQIPEPKWTLERPVTVVMPGASWSKNAATTSYRQDVNKADKRTRLPGTSVPRSCQLHQPARANHVTCPALLVQVFPHAPESCHAPPA